MRLSTHDSERFVNDIILEQNNQLHIIGTIEASHLRVNHALLIARDINLPEVIEDDAVITVHARYITTEYRGRHYDLKKIEQGLSTSDLDDEPFAKHIQSGQYGLTITTTELGERPRILLNVINNVLSATTGQRGEVYRKIVHNGELVSIIDLLLLNDEKERYIKKLLLAGGNDSQILRIAEEILDTTSNRASYDLKTQEEQIELFLKLSKQTQQEVTETVSDEFIERIKNTNAYQFVLNKFEENNLALSHTQQFNSLQHVGLMLNSDHNVMYNLSDMGSGKTLMTVESIIVTQHIAVENAVKELEGSDMSRVTRVDLPGIHIIAPTLSLKSSWLKTFEMFWDLEEVTEDHYTYTIVENGITFHGNIHLVGFTVKGGNLHVKTQAPKAYTPEDFLVIDEIHQLTLNSVRADKFITKEKDTHLSIFNSYRTFVLSGTLANLTPAKWWLLIKFLDIPSSYWKKHNIHTTYEFGTTVGNLETNLAADLVEMARTIETAQERQFDPTEVGDNQVKIDEQKLTQKEQYFYYIYGSQVLQLRDDDVREALEGRRYSFNTNPTAIDIPNFELFYKLVSPSVVTAQSEKISEELFGSHAKQHNAQIIKTQSPLNSDDIKLLKQLHKIVSDAHVYKSTKIATDLANAILNLNDGLQKSTIYDLLNSAAKRSERFLEYLTTLHIDLLEKIQRSNLISTPALEDTEKFKILKDILSTNKDETFLVVVNDVFVAEKLSKALGVKHLTRKEMTDDLNYQDVIDALYTQQNIAVIPQHMIKSSLDLVQANRLVQYQLNTEISDIIQTQNRINRIGQTRETKAYYIATDVLQENIIELFLETYRNIKVAHKGIVELFVDMDKQIDVVSDYITNAFQNIDDTIIEEPSQPSWLAVFQNGGRYEVNVHNDVVANLETPTIIWTGDIIVGKSKSGETVLIHKLDTPVSQPQLGTLELVSA